MRIDRLKEMREKRALSQQELAERAGISVRQLSRYEAGESDPSSEALTAIARTLEVSVDYLVGLADTPTGQFVENSLSAMERRLIWAVRTGQIVEAVKTSASLAESHEQTGIASDEEPVN